MKKSEGDISMTIKVLYFDLITDALKEVIESHNKQKYNMLYWHEMNLIERETALAKAEYLLVAAYKINEDILRKAKKAKILQKTGIGLDNMDLIKAAELGIPVCNTPGSNASGVAELAMAMILSLYRKLLILDKATKNGKWLMWELRPFTFELQNKIHGFIGFGNIGRKTAQLSRAFGTKIVYYDPRRLPEAIEQEFDATYMELDDVLRNSDIVSLHLPLLHDTRDLIGKRELSLMKSTAVLVNVARGGIIDEAALYQALLKGELAGAGIDTFAAEPVAMDNPLLSLDNVIATPHIGAGTRDTLNNVLEIAFSNFYRVDQGEIPQHIVNGVNKLK